MNIEGICRTFCICGDIVACDVIKSGNINDTFKVTFRDGKAESCYIVQQINTYVFHEPRRMMENISHVTGHIASKLGENSDRMVLRFLKTEDGESCFYDDAGKCWRAYRFIDNSITFDSCGDLEILRQAGNAFGKFQMMLGDFDASMLHETIPDFHNTEKRMKTLLSHIDENPLGRAKDAADEIAFFRENYDRAVKLTRMQKEGKLPLRVTHNDTKCNNVLFDTETKAALAVIDLDTVMPGLALHDYGDAVRFSANTAEEDEPDVSKISLDNDKFRAFTEGFVSACGSVLTEREKENLVDSVIAITMELAGRFLDDYLTGDKYFKTDYPRHNLVRTRAQVTLARDIIARYDELNSI
ncbi:MAG: aminoglycoside phosphotransferase family protein, partial [Oscillospiraceae bacterium]|nr:aminoglycoside phosphotransferase family protein [Oscillospiraceae bacterium]